MFSVVFYTNNLVDEKVLDLSLSTLLGIISELDAELVVVSWQPMLVQKNIVWKNHISSHENIYKQIMAGVLNTKHDTIFLAEHDVLYPKSHFDLRPTDKILYDSNIYHLNSSGFFQAPPVNFLSTLVATKSILISGLQFKLDEIKDTGRVAWAEPEGPNGYERIAGTHPIVDIRHSTNFTGTRSSETYLTELDPWGLYTKLNLW